MGYVSFREGMEISGRVWKIHENSNHPAKLKDGEREKKSLQKEKSGVVVKICDTQISVRHIEKFAFDISGLLLLRKIRARNPNTGPFRNVNSLPLLHTSTAM